jgi:hypothetical protein
MTLVNVNGDIWIEPGAKTAIYSSVAADIGQTVLLPLVENIATHAFVPVLGFIPFTITASVGGSGKYVEGQ